jgi:hypothetical protein
MWGRARSDLLERGFLLEASLANPAKNQSERDQVHGSEYGRG